MRENKGKKIAIVGAGPGGLTFAAILQKHGWSPVVYEREPSKSYRQQGGALDLHLGTGQRALKEAGVFDAFQSLARYEGQDLRILDQTGIVYLDVVSDKKDIVRPEIDRGALRKILLDAVEPDSVHWGYDLTEAKALENGQYELCFQNGEKDTVDALVAADGAFSKTRRLLTDVMPLYTGVSLIELCINNVARNHPDIAAFHGRVSLVLRCWEMPRI